ncbi:hypothetical protein MMC25_004452 [Agyrium rufum]|nr:hypothetical protein [Agyrium rufum]
MTSISQQPTPVAPSSISASTSATSQASTPQPTNPGTLPSLAPVPVPAQPRSYANATRKTFSPPPASGKVSASGAVGPATSNTKTASISPAVPALGAPAAVNGNNGVNSNIGPGDHSRKPSVTINASGASGYLPNGTSVAGKSLGKDIQFGQINQAGSPTPGYSSPHVNSSNGSLGVNANLNPRVTSPANSPSPIPQPPASGGKPPSSLQGPGNLNFGNFGDDTQRQHMRPGGGPPSGGLTPGMQPAHLRRESSQSSHGEMNNSGMMAQGPGRGGYPQQGGRGRGGYGQQYGSQQMSYSPNPAFRGPAPPSQPRGGPNMGAQYQNQGRSMPTNYPNSPHQAARSPAMQNAMPMTPQQGQMPMPSPSMQHPQQYNPYAQQMGMQPVNHHSSSVQSSFSSRKKRGSFKKHPKDRPAQQDSEIQQAQIFYPPPPQFDLAPDSGGFEKYLTLRKQNQYGMPPGYDQGYGYPNYPYNMNAQMGYMPAPPSPQPGHYMPQGRPAYNNNNNPYGSQTSQPPSMSRTPSAMSERTSSVSGAPQTPMTPTINQMNANRTANSPGPQASKFVIPGRKSAKIEIKNPNTGDAVKFEKVPPSPALTINSPAPTSNPTPPPRTPSQAESRSSKTDAEKKNEMKEAIARKIAEEQRLKDEATAKAQKDKDDADAALVKEKEEAEKLAQKKREEAEMEAEALAKTKREAEEAAAKEAEAAKAKEAADAAAAAAAAAALAKEEDEKAAKAKKEQEEEEEFARIEAELEKKEREAEEAYQKKKQAEKEAKAKKEAEAAARLDEEMKKAEREAEAIEEARMKKQQAGDEDEAKKESAKLFAALKKDELLPSSRGSPAAAATPEASGTPTPASETSSMAPPPTRTVGKKPAALKLETSKPVEAAQPSAALQSLRSARFLTNINEVQYPSGFASPNPALNSAAPMGKFKYDSSFLMQFQTVFTEKPSETWTERVKETVGDTSETPTRPTTARIQSSLGPRTNSTRTPIPSQFTGMGQFGNPAASRTLPPQGSNTRMPQQMPSGPIRQNTFNNPNGLGFGAMGGNNPMARNLSNTMGQPHSPRAGTSRGGTGRGGSKSGRQQPSDKDAKTMPLTAGMELAPIKVSESGWKPISITGQAKLGGPPPGGDGYLAPDVVQRKVKAALNKMTPNNFDKIAAQILEFVNQSKQETDGRTLRQVIQLTFEKATDEAHWAAMYASFCQRMLEFMTPEIKDETLGTDKNGQIVAGVGLFRKYLLNRCQAEFEEGWKTKLPDKPDGESESAEAVMLSDEYYKAAAAKRRGLGLVRFIGELYKLGMLTSRIMHMCVKKLLDVEGIPDEAEVESLTSLLRTVGVNLDSEEKMRPTMDAYFDRIIKIINTDGLPSRLRFMLMDVVDLRKKRWHGKDDASKGPKTLEEVRVQAAEAERQKEQQRLIDSSRGRGGGGFPGGARPQQGRGDARQFSGPGFQQPPQDYQRNTVGINDLQRLRQGRTQPSSQGGSQTFGPSSMFSANRGSNTRTRTSLAPGLTRGGEDSGASSRTGTPPSQKKDDKDTASSSNAFSALAALDNAESHDATSPPSSIKGATSPTPAPSSVIKDGTTTS